jgi:hypothetical protein
VSGVLGLEPYLYDIESQLLRRFRRLGLRKQPLLMMLILWRLRMRCPLMKICLVRKLGLGRPMGMSWRVCFRELKSLRMRIWIILLRWMWPQRSPCHGWKGVKCLILQLGRGPRSTASTKWCRSIVLARCREVVGIVGWG